MGTKFKVSGGTISCFLLLLVCSSAIAQDGSQQVNSIEAAAKGNSAESSHPRIVNLKHRRYKSLRDNVTSSSERIALPTNIEHPIIHEHIHTYEDIHPIPHIKSPRNGISLQKSPPDLQFGLAFTVPFVSLSTDKILGLGTGKNHDSVSSLFKLNFSGLILAAVVGIVALAGIFLPNLLHTGFNPGFLDSFFPPHFTEGQYNDYGNGWGDKGNWKNEGWNKDWNGRRNGRAENALGAIGVGVLKLVEKFKSGVSTVEKCVVQRVCEEKKSGQGGRISSLMGGLGENEIAKDVGVYKVVRKVLDGDTAICAKVEGLEVCKEFSGVEESFMELVNGFREKAAEGAEKKKGE